jgi:hypothetical protein
MGVPIILGEIHDLETDGAIHYFSIDEQSYALIFEDCQEIGWGPAFI